MHFGAAIFGEETNQVGGLPPVHGVVDETAGAPRGQQAGASKCVKMMGKSRARHLQPPLDIVDAIAVRSRADEETKYLQPVLLAQSVELIDALLHYVDSSIIEMMSTASGQHRLFGGLAFWAVSCSIG